MSLKLLRTPIILLLLALGVRLFLLGSKSVWLDEAVTIRIAEQGQRLIWRGESLEGTHPPFFYLLVQLWLIFGRSESMLRLLSVIFGVGTVGLGYLFGRLLAEKRTATAFATLLAFNPLLVWYAQELRSYSLVACLGMLVLWGTARQLIRPNHWNGLLIVLGCALGMYTHYFFLLIVLPQSLVAVYLLGTNRTEIRPILTVIGSWLVALIAFVPWTFTPNFAQFMRILSGQSHFFFSAETQQVSLATFGVVGVIGWVGVLTLVYRLRSHWQSSKEHPRFLAKTVSPVLLIGYVLFLIVAIYPRGYSFRRQLLVLLPPALFALTALWASQPRPRLYWGAAILFSVIATGINLTIPKDQWRPAAEYITAHYQTGDLIILEPIYQSYSFDYYNQTQLPTTIIERETADQLPALLANAPRIWIIQQLTDVPPHQYARDWLQQNGQLIESNSFYRLKVELYRPIAP